MQEVSTRCSKILPLPEDVTAQITSSTTIPSLTSVVIGLIENALDAGAGKVDISVDFRRAACAVEDDGNGIEPKEFAEDGGLGKRFYTSKYNSPEDVYGGHGTFLSSVAALSILSIISRQRRRMSLSSLVFHHSRPAARFFKAPSHQSLSLHSHGTRVSVQDLFGNMPVRVKQRASSPSKAARVDSKEFDHLTKQVVALILAFHRPIQISLHHAEAESRRLYIGPRPDTKSVAREERNRASIQVPLLCKILTHAGYIEPSEWDDWVKTSARTFNITIRGAIALQPAPSKNVQFLSLGIRPLDSGSGSNVLYEEVNKLFALSSFGNREELSDTDDAKRSKDRRYKQDGFTNKQLRGGGKGVERWPMFYIRIDLAERNDTKKLEREATLNNVLKVLGAMIHGFLKDNHFRPHAVPEAARPEIGSTKKAAALKSTLMSEDAFSTWSRIKSSNRAGPSTVLRSKLNTQEPPEEPKSVPVQAEASDQTVIEKKPMINSAGEEIVTWTNPVSKATVFINSRTGLVVPRSATEHRPATAPAELQQSTATQRLTRTTSRGFMTPQKGSWADSLLSDWENPVFALPIEGVIPQVSFDSPNFEHHGIHKHVSEADITAALAHSSSTVSTHLSKADLQSARVIAQVDRKFILVSVNPTSNSILLVLIDQHAADERIRVESLLHDLQSQPPVAVTKPLVFEIPTRECNLFITHATFFARWGITFTLPAFPPPNARTARLTILTLPTPIVSRCALEPELLVNLLRTELWKLHLQSMNSESTPPQGILDMISSRACRSAIMFNDILTLAEAEMLVSKLGRCSMPFVCAHGRPSMVPLVDVGSGEFASKAGRRDGEREMGFGLLGNDGYEGIDIEDGERTRFVEAWKGWKV